MPKTSIYTRRGFFDVGDGVFKGKGISALLDSREKSAAAISLFGGRENIPSSVMRVVRRRPTTEVDEPASRRNYSSAVRSIKKAKAMPPAGVFEMSARMTRAGMSTMSGGGARAGALSTFPQNIGRSLLLFYSDPGQLVLDPFVGHNSRMSLCIENGRHYIGFGVCSEFMAFNRKLAERLEERFPTAKIVLHLQYSRSLKPVKSNSADFTITSPPYYDVEFYGDEEGQLGKAKTYNDFMEGMGLVLDENLRCLKPGAFAVWFVNDFRRKGRFHAYHIDIVLAATAAGFDFHDILIVDFGYGIRDAFINETIKSRIIPKRHEYALVFRKPETKEKE